MGPKQELEQRVCQRYGWSVNFSQDVDGYWCCDVITGMKEVHRFISGEKSSPDNNDEKEKQKKGMAAASEVALEGLKERIKVNEDKPVKELMEVFPESIDIYQSNKANWEYFWNHKPTVVGIDTEGNNVCPPVLVQIATDEYTILEVPHRKRGRLSYNLARVLSDDSIVKVFCDNFAHKDKKSLDMAEIPEDLSSGSIVDLEDIAAKLLGPVKVARGLSRIVTLAMPELNVRIQKPNHKGRLAKVGRFSMIERGKARPLRSMYDLSEEDRQYAALDAWCTLQAYKRFRDIESS